MCDPPTHRVGVGEPTKESRHLTVGLRPDDEVPMIGQDAVGEDSNRVTLGASIMRRKRLEVGILWRKRCIMATDPFSTW